MKEASGNNVYPPAYKMFQELVVKARENGLPVGIFEAQRSATRQDLLFKKGKTKAKAWHSWHQYGLAADIVFIRGGNWSWAEKRSNWEALGKIGKDLGLEWGGDWGWDMPHFEYQTDLTIAEAIKLRLDGGIEKVWAKISKK
jgi:peptidoglycan L-alanyl-D-glutamate endopeptidase CwlK